MSAQRPTVLHLFAGIGGGALGFKRAGFESVGSFDYDAVACRDFERIVGEPATCADLGTMSPDELRAACTGRPDVVFTSPPCVAFSGCLPAAKSVTPAYLAMSNLALRGVWLSLEAWSDSPPPLFVLENVPRIQSRGRVWLDQLGSLLRSYGYAVRETTHNCGELGGLAQNRHRFLLVARHMKQVPEFLYEPPKQRVRGVGEVLGQLPVPVPAVPGAPIPGGPMHELPRLSAMNWLRLALIPAGGDWRDLPESVALAERSGRQNGGFGVNGWDDGAHAVVAEGTVRNTWGSVADPRLDEAEGRYNGQLRVGPWDEPNPTVIASAAARQNPGTVVADPRLGEATGRHESKYGVADWDAAARTVIGTDRLGSGAATVADPRLDESAGRHESKYGVRGWDEPARTITGVPDLGAGGAVVADPRLTCTPRSTAYGVVGAEASCGVVLAAACHDNAAVSWGDPRVTCYRREGSLGVTRWGEPITAVIGAGTVHNHPCATDDPRLGYEPRKGTMGVTGWAEPSHVIIGDARTNKGANVADPRVRSLIGPALDLDDKRPTHLVIRAADGTWHRPMTDLELFCLQGFDGVDVVLEGSRKVRRQHIGNCVPVHAAEAIGIECRITLEASRSRRLLLSGQPVWVDRAEGMEA